MHRPPMMALWLLCCAVSLTSCSSAPKPVDVISLSPTPLPRALLTPNDSPQRPGGNATQRDAALVIADFQEALASCNADKAAIAAFLEQRR